MCKGRSFAFKEIMMFSAAIVAMWDIDTIDSREWKMPSHRRGTGTYSTNDNTQVWIKHKLLAMEK